MKELVIIGGGPAGLAAAIAAYENGVRDILILERDSTLGGILQQCIHNGFGLHTFGKELTGPEYAWEYMNTMVLEVTEGKEIIATNEQDGIFMLKAKAVVLAMGCRERPRGALPVAGERPAGIYSAGTAQKLVNVMGYVPGREVVILGSGDIGLIMARRMTLEGAKVHAVCELMPYSGGLARNIEQCLHDFDIPLYLSHTVVKIHGRERVEGVTVAKVDGAKRPITGTEQYFPCDTLLLAVGLIPENELSKTAGVQLDRVTGGAVVDQSRQTNVEGIFACGNVLHVHDLVDYVSEEGTMAGKSAADYILGGEKQNISVVVSAGEGIRYTVPQSINHRENVTVYFRVQDIFHNVCVQVYYGDEVIYTKKRSKVAPGEMESIILHKELLPESGVLKLKLEEIV